MTDPGRRGNPRLLELIRDEIVTRGPLSFARFMELALYHPTFGYYARGPERLGRSGDFFTASDVSQELGRCLARQLVEMDERLGCPDPFRVTEFGAGRGLLARDILDALALHPPLYRRLRYVMVDASQAMRTAAEQAAPEAVVVSPDAALPRGDGCVLAVELFDALPVHRVRRRGAALRELVVDQGPGGRLQEREVAPAPEVARWAERYGAAREDGDEAEVCLALAAQVRQLAAVLARGYTLVIDYGHDAARLYDRAHRRGTLLAYRRHQTSEAYLSHVGEQDLTAHVNFSALQDALCDAGLGLCGRTTQDRFLISQGVLSAFAETDPRTWSDPRHVRQRLRVRQLIHPLGMGRTFQVLIAVRGVDPGSPLAGLRDPFREPPPGSATGS